MRQPPRPAPHLSTQARREQTRALRRPSALVSPPREYHTLCMSHPVLTIALAGEADTADLAVRLGRLIRPGDVIALRGDLGTGKTTLARALIRSRLGPGTEVPSPTFTLVQTYPDPVCPIWHFDLYRLEDPGEMRELGLEEAVDGLALIEWPERLGRYLPSQRLEVRLSVSGAGRIARLVDFEDWSTRCDGDWRPEHE
jgi:tRNA threonylcarbamoyladenosine biosynthesis protein TsaE